MKTLDQLLDNGSSKSLSTARWAKVVAGTLALMLLTAPTVRADDAKKVVFVAGVASHGYGAHEHYAGCMILSQQLEQAMPSIKTKVYRNGWPKESGAFDGADSVVIYSDGGDGHPVIPHLDEFDKVMERGVGLVCLHYAVEVPKGKVGDTFLKWLGGYFEVDWSVNPHWTAKFESFPDHPICRGVKPFEINDEWYFHMRFRPGMDHVTPILSAIPPDRLVAGPKGPRSGNDVLRRQVGKPQHLGWACERPDGGRGFGFTGGHVHWNWGHEDFRKVVLNAIVWTAHVDVPANGVVGSAVDQVQLEENQDEPKP